LNKILGEESYQTSPESLNNSKILGRGSYQTPPQNSNNPRIPEKSFRASLVNSTPVNWKEGSLTKPYCAIRLDFIKGSQKKRAPLSKKLNYQEQYSKNNIHQNDSSHYR